MRINLKSCYESYSNRMIDSTDLIRASSVNTALEIIGDRWTLAILHQALLGIHGFEVFQRELKIPRSTLSTRLSNLVKFNILSRTSSSDPDQRYDYRLTAIGIDLFDTALLALAWQKRWVGNSYQAALIHRSHDHAIDPVMICDHCRTPVQAHDVSFHAGPGVSRVERSNKRRRRSSSAAPQSDILPISDELLDLLGDRWTPQVVALGFFGIRRFDEMQETLGLASNILTDRLKRAVQMKLFTQHTYQTRPARKEYRLTQKGLDLYPMLVAMTQWVDRWWPTPGGQPLVLHHKTCDRQLRGTVICDTCKEPVKPGDARLADAPPA